MPLFTSTTLYNADTLAWGKINEYGVCVRAATKLERLIIKHGGPAATASSINLPEDKEKVTKVVLTRGDAKSEGPHCSTYEVISLERHIPPLIAKSAEPPKERHLYVEVAIYMRLNTVKELRGKIPSKYVMFRDTLLRYDKTSEFVLLFEYQGPSIWDAKQVKLQALPAEERQAIWTLIKLFHKWGVHDAALESPNFSIDKKGKARLVHFADPKIAAPGHCDEASCEILDALGRLLDVKL